MHESNEVAGHMFRLAQSNRLLRFCADRGVDAAAVMSGDVEIDLGPICGPDGMIQPEAIDYESL